MDAETYNNAISRIMYDLLALFGFLLVFFTGLYYGYTFHENKEYLYSNITEIQAVNYINNQYVYTVEGYKGTYGDAIAPRIQSIVIVLIVIGALLLGVGFRGSYKYKYKTSVKERIKKLWCNIKRETEK